MNSAARRWVGFALCLAAGSTGLAHSRTAVAQTWQDCWLPVQLAEGASGELHYPEEKPAPTKPVLVALQRLRIEPVPGAPDRLSAGQVVTLAAAGGRLISWPDNSRLKAPEGSFAIDGDAKLSAGIGTRLRLTTESIAIEKDGAQTYLPPGTRGVLVADEIRPSARLDAPASLRPRLDAPASQQPQPDASGLAEFQKGFSGIVDAEGLPSAEAARSLLVRLSKPGLNFLEEQGKLRACVVMKKDGKPEHASIESVKQPGGDVGVADVQLRLPDVPAASRGSDLRVGVILPNGSFGGIDRFDVVSRWSALLWAFGILIVGHILLTFGLSRGPINVADLDATAWPGAAKPILKRGASAWRSWLEIFSGVGGKPSLSNFQIYIWSLLVLIALIYVGIQTGDLLGITTQMLTLLGIAGAGSLSAHFVGAFSGKQAEVPKTRPQFRDILKTEGVLDLFKLQMFLFTILTWVWVGFRVVYDHTFPPLDPNLLLLLGISNGIYVGSKIAGGESPFRVAERADVDLKLLEEAKKNADQDVIDLQKHIDDKDALINAANPAPTADEKRRLEGERALLQSRIDKAKDRVKGLDGQLTQARKAREQAMTNLSKVNG